MKRRIVIIILATFLVVSLVIYYFGQENMVCYYVCINPVYGVNETREPITLYVPIVLTKDGRIHEVMKNLEVYNASEVKIIDTKYGKALKVVTSNYTVIKGHYTYRTEAFSNWDPIKPSLLYDDYHVYIYLRGNADFVTVALVMCSESSFVLEGGRDRFLGGLSYPTKFVTLKNGWNVYDFPVGYTHMSYCKRGYC